MTGAQMEEGLPDEEEAQAQEVVQMEKGCPTEEEAQA